MSLRCFLRCIAVSISILASTVLISCGSRPDFNNGGSKSNLTVVVSAGSPVVGANITVYAVNDQTAETSTSFGNAGVIATGGPTDQDGHATVTFTLSNYSGPIQIVASGSSATYSDPCAVTTGTYGTVTLTPIQIPSNFKFSTYLPNYSSAATYTVALSLLTTLADHEAYAYAKGRHPLHPGAKSLSTALNDRDGLFVKHITTVAASWNPSDLRITLPSSLRVANQTLVDTAYAALFDLAMAQLGHDTAVQAGYAADSTAINGVTLTELLIQDVDADARFDGRGTSGQSLATQGTTPVALTSQFIRKPLAISLDKWIQNTAVNLSGIAQADLVSAGVYAAVSQDGSDLFPDAPTGPFDPTDRAAPALTLLSTPNAYSRQTSLDLHVNALDASGVKAVHARVGSATYNATFDGTNWNFVAIALQSGANNVVVWGEDSSDSHNSGLGGMAPYQLTVPVLVDTLGPVATLDGSQPVYYSEQNLQVAVDSNGRALIPAQYNYAGSRTSIGVGSDIYKVSTRLGWSTQPSAAVLENTNPDNIPYLQFAIPLNTSTDSPIVTANFTINITCSSCNTTTVTGALWPAARTGNGVVYYDLPLSSNIVVPLASLSNTGTLDILLSLTDAAGNTTTTTAGTYTVRFHVIGAPVAIAEDTSYPSTFDQKSVYFYTRSSGNLWTLWNSSATAFYPENVVRLVHYIVTNPGSQPVALSVPTFSSGSWTDSETWSGVDNNVAIAYAIRGKPELPSISGIHCWYGIDTTVWPSPSFADTNYCVVNLSNQGQKSLYISTNNVETCNYDPGTPASWTGNVTGTLQTLAYYQYNNTDTGAASTTTSGRYIVPAATGNAPGLLSLYVVRPRTGLSGTPSHIDSTPYDYLDGTEFRASLMPSGESYYLFCVWPAEPHVRFQAMQFEKHEYRYQLTNVHDILSGSIQPNTWGLNPQGTAEIGEPSTAASSVTVTRTIVH